MLEKYYNITSREWNSREKCKIEYRYNEMKHRQHITSVVMVNKVFLLLFLAPRLSYSHIQSWRLCHRCILIFVTARCHAPLGPWSVQAFSVNARSPACNCALTNLDNAQHALSNPLIARWRIMHRNKYETSRRPMHPKWPNVPYIKNTTP